MCYNYFMEVEHNNPMGEKMGKKLVIERGKEKISSNGGLAIVGAIIMRHKIGLRADSVKLKGGDPDILNSDVLVSYIGLQCMGRINFKDIELYRHDEIFRITLGLKTVPSEGTLRQRLDEAKGAFDPLIKEFNAALLAAVNPTPVKTESGLYIPVDVDVSTFDNSKSHKAGVGRTYMGYDGYAPIFAYAGLEGFMLACELRPGIQHCQKGTPEFLDGLIVTLDKAWGSARRKLLRLDSGNDAGENLSRLKGKVEFIIKRNPRSESLDGWLEIAKALGEAESPRDGKTVWTGSFVRDVNGVGSVRVVFEVVVRTSKFDKKLGAYQDNLLPDIELATFWTSLPDKPKAVIELYHQHGTSEQFHSELKTDMNVERLPSGKFATNATFLQLTMLAFNTLRMMGVELLTNAVDLPIKLDVERRRIRSVIMDLVMAGCKLVKHSKRLTLKTGEGFAWFEPFRRLYLKFC